MALFYYFWSLTVFIFDVQKKSKYSAKYTLVFQYRKKIIGL